MAMEKKLAINFHETFSLSRDSIRQILEIAKNEKLSKELLARTSLGTNYQKAMPKYAFRAGLLDQRNKLTSFGRFVAQYDPAMSHPSTQWLIHYHLAKPHSPTAFWSHLVIKRFIPGNTFTNEDLANDITKFLQEHADNIHSTRSIRSTTTVFIGTYLKQDGLGNLRLLQEQAANTYLVLIPETPSKWVIGCALVEYWGVHYKGRLTINLDDLIEKKFAGVFLLGEERLTDLLLQLKQEGMIDLYRISRPYQIVLLQPDCEYVLQKIYHI
ncbi:DUF4007 family protein [Roseiflexus sp.]